MQWITRVLHSRFKFFFSFFFLQGSKVGSGLQAAHPGALSPLMMYNSEHLAQPPPAHMGIPPVHIDPKTGEFACYLVNLVAMTGTTMLVPGP